MAKKTAKATTKSAPKPAKITASSKPRKKSELFNMLAEHNGLKPQGRGRRVSNT